MTSTSFPRSVWLYLISGLVLLFLILPCLLVFPISFSESQFLEFPPTAWSTRWYKAFLYSKDWRQATFNSCFLAVGTVLIATPLGLAASYALHASRSVSAALLRTVFVLPMVVPGILTAVGMFFLYSRLDINNTYLGLLLSHVTLALPFVVITTSSGLVSFDAAQERAARSLGANRWRAFLTVVFPQIRPSVMSAAIIAFVSSFDEAIVSIFVSGSATETLTRRIFQSMRDQVDPTVAAVSSLLMLVSIGVLISNLLLTRR